MNSFIKIKGPFIYLDDYLLYFYVFNDIKGIFVLRKCLDLAKDLLGNLICLFIYKTIENSEIILCK